MAERRMFTKKITDSDAFIEMSSAAQALYFHLNQGADDDGFNNQVSNAIYKAHASVDDLKVLMLKNFIIRFESGVIVIKHWRMHNTLRKDRYTPTNFQEELKQLGIKDNGAYTLGCQVVAKRLPQDSIGKVSIVDNNISIVGQPDGKCSFLSEIKEIIAYLNAKIGTAYKPNSKNTQTCIKARLNEGFTVDDFKKVIDKKVAEWLHNSEMAKFLRPQTLFSPKFESYLNEPIVTNSGQAKQTGGWIGTTGEIDYGDD